MLSPHMTNSTEIKTDKSREGSKEKRPSERDKNIIWEQNEGFKKVIITRLLSQEY